MSKYSLIESELFGIFATAEWKAEKVKSFPNNFIGVDAGSEYIRISVLPQGKGTNIYSVSGVIIIEIFTPAGMGPSKASIIADKLDKFLCGKAFSPTETTQLQVTETSLQHVGKDSANPTLHLSKYTAYFNYYGVQP